MPVQYLIGELKLIPKYPPCSSPLPPSLFFGPAFCPGLLLSSPQQIDALYRFCILIRERVKKRGPFCSLLLRRGPDPPFFVVPWESKKFLVNIFVVVDAIGLETDFTLETNRKRMTEELLKST